MESHLIPACTNRSRARALVCECILYDACSVSICICCSFLLALMASGLCLKQVRTRIKPTSSQLPSLKFVCQCLCSLSPFWSQSLLGCIKLILHVISKWSAEWWGRGTGFGEAERASSALGGTELQTGTFPRKFHSVVLQSAKQKPLSEVLQRPAWASTMSCPGEGELGAGRCGRGSL